ncbi:MAG: ABC-F family ATP-binding cassette domain-containing protein [Desulfobulbaceae bacterium]|nr:ABC-F family ATP-binding cassette domain-containing protein [Desulfobulbaceae bacterium]
MTLLLTCQNIRKAIGPRTLFDSLSFTVNRGDRLALIGANGSGKTTLLRILAGLDSPDQGKISLAQDVLLGYLPQQENLDEHASAAEVLFAALHSEHLDEAERHNQVNAMLSRAEFDNFDVPVSTLSGGWRKRLAICRSLLLRPDLLIMDEPTNHLDLEGIVWLEKLLNNAFPGCPSTFIMVSHDRFFLENLATRVIEISPSYPEGNFQVDGNYSTFLQRKEQFLDQQQDLESRLTNRVRRETEWLHRGPKARATKARYRIDEAHRLKEELGRLKTRNRLRTDIAIDFDATGRKTKKLMTAKGLSKSYDGKTLFADLDIILSPGKRIGLLGKNGSGKSTLMQILAAAGRTDGLQPDTGSIRTADGVRILYFAQDRSRLVQEHTLRQALSPEGDSVMYRDRSLHVVTWAQKFLFRADQLDTPVGNLSGGEQARILIADLMRRPADILLLDEPTNDLDIPSIQVLEESLLDFPGAIVLVTHDRYLLNRICDLVLGFDGQGNVTAFADYQQWQDSLDQQMKKSSRISETPRPKQIREKAGRLSYLDQREYDGMEEMILAAEKEEQELLMTMDDPENVSDPQLLQESWKNLEKVQEKIKQLYARWAELETKKNSGS